MNRFNNIGETSQAATKQPKVSNDIGSKDDKKQSQIGGFEAKAMKETPNIQVSCNKLIPVDQLKDFIMGTIKDKYERNVKSSFTCAKPYTKRIDNLKMSAGYQPPKLQQFDGKGNSKQHIDHFVETCYNASIDRDLLVK